MSVDAVPPSLDGSANALLELAGLFQAGRPEPTLTDRTGDPNAHGEVDRAAKAFAGFAADQYQDAVALLSALSTQLAATAGDYRQADDETARRMDAFLRGGKYQAGG